MVAVVFVISIPIAFASTIAAAVIWIGMFAVGKRFEGRLAALHRRRRSA